jgi:peptide/nickel transport system permease protein
MTAAAKSHLARFVILLAAVVVVNFVLPRLLPGSPLSGAAGEGTVAFLPSGALEEIRRAYGLDQPPTVQFVRYLDGLRRGDLGRSLATHRPVAAMVGERLPWTLGLLGGAVLLAAAIGATLGTAAAWRPHGWKARLAEPLVVGVGALPEFLVAMALIVGLGTGAKLFPVGGATAPFLTPTGAAGWLRVVGDVLAHAALPGATLVIALTPAFFLLSRNALAAVLGERYLLTARGKGLGERRILWHAWRNAMPPVLTLLGLRLAFAVTGAALVERIFAYPGMGLLLFEAVVRRDYPVIQGVFLMASLIIVTANVALDLAATWLDPRIRQARE